MSLESQNLEWSSFALASYGGQPSPVSSGTYPEFKVFAVFWPASRSLKGEGFIRTIDAFWQMRGLIRI